MNRRASIPLLALMALAASAGRANAHRLDAQCFVRPGWQVQVESWYETGEPPRGARVEVFRADGQLLTAGKLDMNGVFGFSFVGAENAEGRGDLRRASRGNVRFRRGPSPRHDLHVRGRTGARTHAVSGRSLALARARHWARARRIGSDPAAHSPSRSALSFWRSTGWSGHLVGRGNVLPLSTTHANDPRVPEGRQRERSIAHCFPRRRDRGC